MKSLIVNGDDFGLTPGVVEGILKAHSSGIVTSTTILINLPEIETHLKELKAFPGLDLGIHLNVTFGKPVYNPAHIKTLLGEDGRFIRKINFESVDPEEVEAEWRAQMQKAESLNLNITHLDTHHHTHLHPAFLDVLAEIAKEYNLAVRSQQPWVRDFLRARAVPTPDHFIEDFYGEGKVTPDHLKALLGTIPDGTTELCCHPAEVDEALRQISSYREPRAVELETLTAPEIKTWLSESRIELSNFVKLPIPLEVIDRSCDLK